MSEAGLSLRERLRTVAGWIGTPLAILFLHLALSMYFWLPEFGGRALLRPTLDLPALILLVTTLAWKPRTRRLELGTRIAFTALGVIFLILGFAQGFARHEFGYDVVL